MVQILRGIIKTLFTETVFTYTENLNNHRIVQEFISTVYYICQTQTQKNKMHHYISYNHLGSRY